LLKLVQAMSLNITKFSEFLGYSEIQKKRQTLNNKTTKFVCRPMLQLRDKGYRMTDWHLGKFSTEQFFPRPFFPGQFFPEQGRIVREELFGEEFVEEELFGGELTGKELIRLELTVMPFFHELYTNIFHVYLKNIK
jgi:hypothetical protein